MIDGIGVGGFWRWERNGGCTIWIDGMYGGEGFSKLFFPEVLVTFEGGRGQE